MSNSNSNSNSNDNPAAPHGAATLVAALSALVLLVGVATTALALRNASSHEAATAPPSGSTPVLSIRRLPTVLRSAIGNERLEATIEEILSRPDVVDTAETSCLQIEVDGATVAAMHPERSVIPASTLKLITASATLATLDGDARLRTDVRSAAAPVAGTVDGDLWFVGGGDPLLESVPYTATQQHHIEGETTPLGKLADQVVDAGVRRVTGSVVGDPRLFDDQRSIPSWKPSYVRDGEVGPLGGLLVDDNFTLFNAKKRRIAATDVGRDAAEAFKAALTERGVKVDGDSRSAGDTEPKAEVAAPNVVTFIESIPVRDIVAEMLRESDNTTAEVLLKLIGVASIGEGTTAAGAAAAQRSLQLEGATKAELATLRMVDGSGLSRSDRVSCPLLVRTLRDKVATSPIVEALAVMGKSGTLAKRLRDSPAAGVVRAKTGTLDGVSSLVGTLPSADGRTIVFGVVFNGLQSTGSGVAAGDALAEALLSYPQAPEPVRLAPIG